MVADIPAVQGVIAPPRAWAVADHAPMTRTARSRLNGRLHQNRPGPHHNQPPAALRPIAQPAPAMQPSFMQRNPLLAGLAAGIAGSYIGHMLFGATESSAGTTDAGEQVGETNKAAGASNSTGILLILMLLGAGAFYYFLRVRRSPTPEISGITRSNALSDTLPAGTFRQDYAHGDV